MTLDKTSGLSENLYSYLLEHNTEHFALQGLREETQRHEKAFWQVPPEQGNFMGMLIQLIGARKTLEIGVYTGYSTLSVALNLPEDGQVIACDINEQNIAIGKKHWRKAGVDHKISFRHGPAAETLDELIDDGHENTFDFAFIDADKANYDQYYEKSLRLLRTAGLIMIDNVFWHGGRVADPEWQDEDTRAIRVLNSKIHNDERVRKVMLPLSDGIMLVQKL